LLFFERHEFDDLQEKQVTQNAILLASNFVITFFH